MGYKYYDLTDFNDADFEKMYTKAKLALNPRRLSRYSEAGGVSAALMTDKGNIYTGQCIDTGSSMGLCAEHAAIAAMVTAGENKIEKIVAVLWNGRIIPPCGKCRELIKQIHDENMTMTQVMVDHNVIYILSDLMPFAWMEIEEEQEG